MTTAPKLFTFPGPAAETAPHRSVPRELWGDASAPEWGGARPLAATTRPVWPANHAAIAHRWVEHHAPRAPGSVRAREEAFHDRTRESWGLPEPPHACCVTMHDAPPRGLNDLSGLGFKVKGCDNNSYHPHGTLRFPVSGGFVPVEVYERNGSTCTPHPLVQSVFTSKTTS